MRVLMTCTDKTRGLLAGNEYDLPDKLAHELIEAQQAVAALAVQKQPAAQPQKGKGK